MSDQRQRFGAAAETVGTEAELHPVERAATPGTVVVGRRSSVLVTPAGAALGRLRLIHPEIHGNCRNRANPR